MSAQGEDRSDFQAVMPPLDRNGKKLDFIIFKATEGTTWTSRTYKQNVALAKSAGVPYGSYHFFHPSLNVEAQVALFLSFTAENGGLHPGTILACDSEIQSGANAQAVLMRPNRSHLLEHDPGTGLARVRLGASIPTSDVVTDHALHAPLAVVNSATRRFLDETATGVRVALGSDVCQEMLYSFLGMLPQLASCTGYPLWVADFTSHAPASVHPWSNWVIWQFAGGGGRGGSDQDGYNGDAAAFNKWRLSKVGSHPHQPDTQPVPQWEKNMLNALPTLGKGAKDQPGHVYFVTRLQALAKAIGTINNLPNARNLTVDGNYGDSTVKAIKAVQQLFGFTGSNVDGITGPMTWSVLVTGGHA